MIAGHSGSGDEVGATAWDIVIQSCTSRMLREDKP